MGLTAKETMLIRVGQLLDLKELEIRRRGLRKEAGR